MLAMAASSPKLSVIIVAGANNKDQEGAFTYVDVVFLWVYILNKISKTK